MSTFDVRVLYISFRETKVVEFRTNKNIPISLEKIALQLNLTNKRLRLLDTSCS